MNELNILKENFKEINKAYFEKESGIMYLRIEVNLRNLNAVSDISKKINEYLEANLSFSEKYYLDIFSPGTDEIIELSSIDEFIGENVKVKLFKVIKGMKEFEGEIIETKDKNIVIKWNAKGQFRKQEISISNIDEIKKYIKIKKRSE